MKKVIGLCLLLLISSVSVFAQSGKRNNRGGDPARQDEKMITDLKLTEEQAVDFRKVEAAFREKMQAEREQADSDRQQMREKMIALQNDRNAEMKKILTEEQYKQYLEMQRARQPRKGDRRK